ncbi:hypothetical protein TARUN_68 [Trichoderma arundinaceum]|uniref:Uncharacterized protein n=1 Tax=Trichoderma arundinaceum TaxID=490622 RepID=A0A395P1A5_TRIAR|nr:hypothetical protein TARUN_68 [Trichoderma arundinaceum]
MGFWQGSSERQLATSTSSWQNGWALLCWDATVFSKRDPYRSAKYRTRKKWFHVHALAPEPAEEHPGARPDQAHLAICAPLESFSSPFFICWAAQIPQGLVVLLPFAPARPVAEAFRRRIRTARLFFSGALASSAPQRAARIALARCRAISEFVCRFRRPARQNPPPGGLGQG